MSYKMTPERLKNFWANVNKLIAGLPEEAANVIRRGAQEMVDADGELDVDELSAKFSGSFNDAIRDAKPIRTIKLTPKLAKRVKEDTAWLKATKAKAEKLDGERKVLDEKGRLLLEEAKQRKESLDALTIVEMGISTRRNAFRINDQTMELEVLFEKPDFDQFKK